MSAKHRFKRIAACCLLGAALLPIGGCFESPEELCQMGKAAYEKGEYQEAAKLYAKSAEKNNAEAQCLLGCMYLKGEGTEKNAAKAVDLLEAANALNYSEAALKLGNISRYGLNGELDTAKALEYYTKAAEAGNAEGQYRLAEMYFKGQGAGVDKAKAALFYEKAALQDHVEALIAVGNMYFSGNGVEKDVSKAAGFFAKAAEKGSADAQFKLAEIYYFGKGIPQDKAKAAELYARAADSGSLRAALMAGKIYLEGDGADKDLAKAEAYLLKAADSGKQSADSAKAAGYLADLYALGQNGQKDVNKIFKYTKQAALADLPVYMYKLGIYYAQGLGCPKDRPAAVKWIKKAAQAKYKEAQTWLADRRGSYKPMTVADKAEAALAYGRANGYNPMTCSDFKYAYANDSDYFCNVIVPKERFAATMYKQYCVAGVFIDNRSESYGTENFGWAVISDGYANANIGSTMLGNGVRTYANLGDAVIVTFKEVFQNSGDMTTDLSCQVVKVDDKKYIPPKIKGWEDLLNDK
ncbi:SEL1-like repeat protein [bacterium]|nr:SEL1-like repeat protein [bacterium]